MPVDPSRVQLGMAVVGADGEPVGTVKELHDAAVLVDRPMARDVYVPFYAIDGPRSKQVVMSVPHDLVDAMDWPSPPVLGVFGATERADTGHNASEHV